MLGFPLKHDSVAVRRTWSGFFLEAGDFEPAAAAVTSSHGPAFHFGAAPPHQRINLNLFQRLPKEMLLSPPRERRMRAWLGFIFSQHLVSLQGSTAHKNAPSRTPCQRVPHARTRAPAVRSARRESEHVCDGTTP